MASYSKRMVNLLIIMYAPTLLLSVATESQSNKCPLREISCTIQVRKKYPLSRLRQILLARDFRSTAKCQYMKNEILIVTRDLRNYGGVWEAIVNKTVCGHGLCVFQQRFAMHWTLALFLASVFCSLYCWTISKKQRKELVSRDNHFTFCQMWYLEHYWIRAGSAQFLWRFPQICFLLLAIVLSRCSIYVLLTHDLRVICLPRNLTLIQ